MKVKASCLVALAAFAVAAGSASALTPTRRDVMRDLAYVNTKFAKRVRFIASQGRLHCILGGSRVLGLELVAARGPWSIWKFTSPGHAKYEGGPDWRQIDTTGGNLFKIMDEVHNDNCRVNVGRVVLTI